MTLVHSTPKVCELNLITVTQPAVSSDLLKKLNVTNQKIIGCYLTKIVVETTGIVFD